MKYKVGDRVKVRNDLIPEVLYGKLGFVENMLPYCGKWVTIDECDECGYYIDIDDEGWSWSDEMFEDFKDLNNIIESFEQRLDEAMDKAVREYQELHKELNELKKIYNKNDV